MPKNAQLSNATLYKTPFSKAYWKQAASEFKKTKVLVFAALMIALRVALKMVSIPIGPEMRINSAFIVNAYSAAVFGPVVAIVAAIISDTLGCILFPTGVYFFPFIITEIAGSLFYALCFYRSKISTTRIMIATFLINFGVNVVIQTPIMMWYYDVIMGKYYAPFDLMRIVKNLVEMPVECFILTVVFRALIPSSKHLGLVPGDAEKLRFTKKNLIFMIVLFLVGVLAVTGYSIHTYNTTSLSASYSTAERFTYNELMRTYVEENNAQLEGKQVVAIVESALPKVGDPNVTYAVAVYTVNETELEANIAEKLAADPESTYGLDTLKAYSKSKAKADDALDSVGYATIVADKKTDKLVSYADDFE